MIRVYFKPPDKPKRDKQPIGHHADGKRWRIYERGRVYRLPCGLSIFPTERSALAMLFGEFVIPGLFQIEDAP